MARSGLLGLGPWWLSNYTVGICLSGQVGFVFGFSGSFCLVESGLRNVGITETLGAGATFPLSLGGGLGVLESNAKCPTDLAHQFSDVGGSVGPIDAQAQWAKAIREFTAGMTLGWPLTFDYTGTNTWVQSTHSR